jgi:hypothetical protein
MAEVFQFPKDKPGEAGFFFAATEKAGLPVGKPALRITY